MRLFKLAVILFAALLGVVFAALNTAAATVDIYFVQWSLPTGILVLATILLGAVLASVALVFGSLLPLRRRLRKLERAAAESGRRSGVA